MKDDFQIMKLNIEANMLRIEQLLQCEGIENQYVDEKYWRIQNRKNSELRQRLKILRKDALLLEKSLKG